MLGRRKVRHVALVAALVVVGTLGACKGEERVTTFGPPTTKAPNPTVLTAAAPAGPVIPEPTKLAFLATAQGSTVHVHANPADPKPVKVLSNPTFEYVPLAMFVADRQGDWLHVRYPERPNGVMGWVRASEVALTPLDNRIVISLGYRSLRVVDKNQQVIYETNVAVGKPRTPTPLGRFFVDVWLPNPGSPYGKFMLSIGGFSDVLKNFGGGRGQIAMHGWSDTSAMGRDVSNGCIRMRNEDIVKVSTLAPLGTPVDIVA